MFRRKLKVPAPIGGRNTSKLDQKVRATVSGKPGDSAHPPPPLWTSNGLLRWKEIPAGEETGQDPAGLSTVRDDKGTSDSPTGSQPEHTAGSGPADGNAARAGDSRPRPEAGIRAYMGTNGGTDLRRIGRNVAYIGSYLAGGEGTAFMKRMSKLPDYIPPDAEREYHEGLVDGSPVMMGQVKYPWWTTTYTNRLAAFAVRNMDLINAIKPDQFIEVLAITAQSFSYSHTENLSMHTYSHHNAREHSLFTARSLRYLGCRREPMKGDNFTVDTVSGEWMFDYKYMKDNRADREFFIHFVRAMMARNVKDDWLTRLVMDTSMVKYQDMPSDVMLNNEGMVALRQQRDYRTQSLHAHKEIKMGMTTTSTIPCTVDKFAFGNDPGGTVLVYGSGNTHCAMRYNWSSTYCVDPLYDGPADRGFKGLHSVFHQHLSNGIIKLGFTPSLIASDACAYLEQRRTLLVGARGNHELRDLTRSMDPERTNQLAAEIVNFWLNQGYQGEFYMKSGVHNVYPPLFSHMRALAAIKTRPTNAEVILRLKGTAVQADDGRSKVPGPELTWARCINRHNIVIFVANNQRMMHEKERTFPRRAFGYPANMDTLLANARKNVILFPPPDYVIVNKRELAERKKMERGVDFDDIEHSSDTFGTKSDSEDSDVEDYYN